MEVPKEFYELLCRTIEAVTHNLAPETKMLLLAKYQGDVTEGELKLLSAQPAWVRAVLRRRGATLVLNLIKENWAHMFSASAVRDIFGIPSSTLHRDKDGDRVIAFRVPGATEFLFPAEQFSPGEVDVWARDLISTVGNGAPALQFLYVKRPSLGGKSFAETLRGVKTPETIENLRHGIARLGAE